jgi:hypothetical protein
MAQADQTIQNATFPTVRADINDNLAALFTDSSGSTAPSVTVAFQDWIDTSGTNPLWKKRNAANNAWITLGTIVGSTIAFEGTLPDQSGNAGEYLTTDGTDASWGAITATGQLLRAPQILTSGTNYTAPANCTTIYVECIGGGGGGGRSSDGGGGGGAGGYGAKYFTVTASTSYTYAIGAGGAGRTGTVGNGTGGGNTTFTAGGTTVTASGGGGGGGTTPAGGSGGNATDGDLNATGGGGGGGEGAGGTGGNSFFGGGGRGIVGASSSGQAGSLGGGGSGGGVNGNGGAGGGGIIRIWEYS